MMRPLFAWLLCLGVLMQQPANASTSANPQAADLHQLRLSISGSLGDFYLLYGVDTDPAHIDSITARLALADKHLVQLNDSADGELLSSLRQLQPHWQRYRALLSELAAQLQHKQTPEGGAIAELIKLNRRLSEQCDKLSEQLAREQTPQQQTSRALEMRLQTLTTDYIAHSVGANSLGGDAPALDEQSKAFEADLQHLREQIGSASEHQRLLRDIEKKWHYIEPSLLNYRQNNVPSLINRYSMQIIAELGQLADQAQTSTP
nr:hypothetical protein [uncultured Pseudomonas sp.]